MRVGLATIRRGRAEHLARQAVGVGEQTVAPDGWVVVSMDPGAAGPRGSDDVGHHAPSRSPAGAATGPRPERSPGADDGSARGAPRPRTVALPVPDGVPLPLAAARNAAIRALGDVDLVVLLDVDCVPAPRLIERYADAARRRDGLLAGPVGHLPPGRPSGPRVTDADRAAAEVRGDRPVPGDGELLDEPRHERFWSLSFAVSPRTHERIGGFDEGYVGYGGEDTDYALRARRAGVGLTWVGGAWAHHQHHPVSSPPREHLHDIVDNARRFRGRWGVWPMEGWLRAFAAEGLVDWDPTGDRLEAVAAPHPAGAGTGPGDDRADA